MSLMGKARYKCVSLMGEARYKCVSLMGEVRCRYCACPWWMKLGIGVCP